MRKNFTKADLKNCMVVEYRNGSLRLVVGDTLIGKGGFLPLSNYKENLIYENKNAEFDIVKIYDTISNLDHLEIIGALDLLWERPELEVKEVTMSEVEEKFGCKVKIINNNYME